MKATQQALVDAILRSDFKSFVRRCFMTLNPGADFATNWHIDAIAHQLGRVTSGELTRLVINMPPRHLKSLIVSIAYPAYILGLDPTRRIVVISYSDELTTKHAADFRAVVNAEWYRRLFPRMRLARDTETEVTTTLRGYRRATTVKGTLTGLGGNLFIIDDPQKAADAQSKANRDAVNQWVSNTLMSRLDDKGRSAIIVVMQRVHLDDLSGYLLKPPSEWSQLSLAAKASVEERIAIGQGRFHRREAGEALHPERESLATLEKLQQTMGPDMFGAQYMQAPVPLGGNMIKREWLRYYRKAPERKRGAQVIQSWDTAVKNGAQNDWSVCTTFLLVDERYYLLDLTRGRYDYPTLRATAIDLARRYRPDVVLIEDAATGTSLAQELPDHVNVAVELVAIDRDKVGRLYVQQGKFAAGRVYLPEGAQFLAELEVELLTFPQAPHDDQVDSISQALAFEGWGYDETLNWVC